MVEGFGIYKAKTDPFDAHPERYDSWFEVHKAAYASELLALRSFVPMGDNGGLEIGVGTGRFAGPLGVSVGLDPSDMMLSLAADRGVQTVKGVAEMLPFPDGSFDYVLVVTTLCFVNSPERVLTEIHRVLRSGGKLVVGFIDRGGSMGRSYLANQSESTFFREAVFYSVAEIGELLRARGFVAGRWGQTLFRPLFEIREIEPMRLGSGDGAFVVVAAERSGDPVERVRKRRLSRLGILPLGSGATAAEVRL